MGEVGAAFPTGVQTSELVQQRASVYDELAHGLVGVASAAAAAERLETALSETVPVCVVVVAAVGNKTSGLRRGRPTRPHTGGITFTSGSS